MSINSGGIYCIDGSDDTLTNVSINHPSAFVLVCGDVRLENFWINQRYVVVDSGVTVYYDNGGGSA